MDLNKIIYRAKRLIRREELKLVIDVASCNLKCMMCPRGGVNGLKNEGAGLMPLGLFKKIIDKFANERVTIREIEFGNWGEPLLNPELPAMIRYVKERWEPYSMGRKGSVGISTNLNCLKDPAALMESGVDRIRVSISGMTQDVYSKNHIGGNIETVLKNILRLVEIRDKRGMKGINLGIGFHDMVYNKKDAETAKRFCEEHGLMFTLLQMYILSVEDNVKFQQEKERLSKFYSAFIDLKKELSMMKRATNPVEKCQFRRSVVTVNYDGRLVRCCAVFEEKYFMGDIFDFRIRDIPGIKSRICGTCARIPMSWR